MANEAFYQEAIDTLVNHDKVAAEDVAKRAIAAGVTPQDIMQNGFVVGIRKVGDAFDEGEVYLPELMLAAAAMEAAMEVCNAALPEGESESRGVVVIGTVEGDVHDIGKAIVCAYLRANGYDVYDLGRDVPVEDFVDKAEEVNADIIGASALLTATMRKQSEIIAELDRPRHPRQVQGRRRRRPVHAGVRGLDRRRRVCAGRQRRRQEDRETARHQLDKHLGCGKRPACYPGGAEFEEGTPPHPDRKAACAHARAAFRHCAPNHEHVGH